MRTLLALVATAVILTACSKWPPHRDDVVENFHKKRAAIEALEAAYRETDYREVSLS